MAIQQMIHQTNVSEIVGEDRNNESSVEGQGDPTQSASLLRLDLLGTPQFFAAERPVALRTRKTLALLAYLAVERGQHPREQLANLFWPEADIEDARASLRTTLSYIRQGLGCCTEGVLLATRDSVCLAPSAQVQLDLRSLHEVQLLIRQLKSTNGLRRQIEDAVDQYGGPFLEGIALPDAPDFDGWVEGQRMHWQGIAEELLDHLATLQLQDGDAYAAATTLERWTIVNPDDEAAWKRLIQLHLRQANFGGARRVWTAYRQSLAALDAEPSPTMLGVGDQLDASTSSQELSAVNPTARSDAPDFRCMPFVGRTREWSALLAALERSRSGHLEVVVVEGEAGAGKSRLVSQFLQTITPAEADIVAGHAFETADELSYAAVVDALRTRLEAENAPDDLLGDLWLGELSRLAPELRERYPDLPWPKDEPVLGRVRLFEAVTRFGQALAARKPLILYVGDVQWADAATRDLVRYSIRRWAESSIPVLVILTVRSEDLQSERELGRWLAGLERDAPLLCLSLQPLESHDLVQMVSLMSGLDQRFNVMAGWSHRDDDARRGHVETFVEVLMNQTGGHPLQLTQTMRVLLEAGALRIEPSNEVGWVFKIPDVREHQTAKRVDEALRTLNRVRKQEQVMHPATAEANELAAKSLLADRIADQRPGATRAIREDSTLLGLDLRVQELGLRSVRESMAPRSLTA